MPRRVERRSARSGSDTRKLDHVLGVRFTAADLADVRAQADMAGLTPGEYVRRRALGHPVVGKVDTAMLNELRRLGGLTKHLFSEGSLSSERGRELLVALLAAIRRVGMDDDS